MNDGEKFIKEFSKMVKEQVKQFDHDESLKGTAFELCEMQKEAYLKIKYNMEKDAYIALSNAFSKYGEIIDPDNFKNLFNSVLILHHSGIDTPEKIYRLLIKCEKEGII